MAAAAVENERRGDVDIAPIVKGFLAFVVKGASRLVELHKDKEQMETLERLFVECASADRSHQSEIIETVLEILLPDDCVGDLKSTNALPNGAKEQAEGWRFGIGKRIQKFRKDKGWTQEDLAVAADIPQSHVCRLETGKHAPTHLTIERIAKALEVKPTNIDPNYPEEMDTSDVNSSDSDG